MLPDAMLAQSNVFPMPMMAQPSPIAAAMQARVERLANLAGMTNAADELDETELSKIGAKVVREYGVDRASRKEWEDRAKRAMDLARQKKEAKTFPWANASNVKYPLLTTAALQFAARAYPAICDGPRVVKTQVLGADLDGSKAESADNVSQHMSYQLLYEVDGWEASVDTSLHQIPIIGCAFRKVYEDSSQACGYRDDLVSAFDFVVNQSTKSLKTVPRSTHVFQLYPHEIAERQREGRYLSIDIRGEADTSNEDEDAPHTLLEQHRYLDFDDDGVPEPWIVTVHEKTERVLRIAACYDPQEIVTNTRTGAIVRIPRREYFVKIPFVPDPEGGFYDVGFGHLLEPLSDVIDSTINQMMDAGTLQNSGGGFIGAGVNLGKGKSVVTFKPGEYKVVQTAGPDLRQGIVNMEHPGPSKVLFELLGLMIEAGKDVASVQDILVGDSPRNQTATTTMAMIEQGLKVFTAIYKRIFRAMKDEYRLIFQINKRLMQGMAPKYIALLDKPAQVAATDYMGEFDIMPVADPNTVTDMQRMAKAQFVMEQAATGNPHINVFEATKRAFEAARIERPEEVLIPPPPPPQPGDPPPEPSPEERMVQAKIAEQETKTQAAAQAMELKAADQQMGLQAKMADLEMQLAAKQREQEMRMVEAEAKHMEQLRALQLKSDEMDQRYRSLQLKEEEIRLKHESAKAKITASEQANEGAAV
jgi:chaperonin GroES